MMTKIARSQVFRDIRIEGRAMKIRYLFATVVVLSIISLFIGVKDISPLQLFSMTEQQQHIMLVSRIPRLVSLILAGVSMSICGLIMRLTQPQQVRIAHHGRYDGLCQTGDIGRHACLHDKRTAYQNACGICIRSGRNLYLHEDTGSD